MKKLAFIIGIISLAVACNTVEEPSNIQDQTQEANQVVDVPVLKASIDESAEDQTKSYLREADWQIVWTANDEISAFVNNTTNLEYIFQGATGDQSGDFNRVSTAASGSDFANVYAVYPYNASNAIDANGVMTVNFPAAQTYASKSFGQGANTMVAVSSSADNLSFKSACGYLMLKLYGTNVNVKSISIKGNNHEKIAGTGTITMSLGGEPTVNMASNATDEIVLTCTNAVTIGNSSSNYTEFWFTIPPVTFNDGFTITVTTDDGGIFTKSNNNTFQVVRNLGKKMAPIQVVPVPRTNLSANGTANSYIVNTNAVNSVGYYFTSTVAGNGIEVGWSDIGFTDVHEAYPTGGGSAISGSGVAVVLNQNNCISNVYYSNGKIYFNATGNKGNAKVTLTNDGRSSLGDSNGVWTWHIWCTDQPGTSTVNGYTIMDRNLGAVTTGWVGASERDQMTGFYYPFGHYIGFTYDEYYNHGDVGGYRMIDTYAYHPEKPYLKANEYFQSFRSDWDHGVNFLSSDVWNRLWNRPGDNKKTMYDPCPLGYRVMTDAVLAGYNNSTATVEGNHDVAGFSANWYGIFIDGTFFPFNGKLFRDDAFSSTPYEVYLFLWTNSYYAGTDEAKCYTIHRKNYMAAEGGGFIYDKMTRGKGVRCMAGF